MSFYSTTKFKRYPKSSEVWVRAGEGLMARGWRVELDDAERVVRSWLDDTPEDRGPIFMPPEELNND